jgi:hypothetical protein
MDLGEVAEFQLTGFESLFMSNRSIRAEGVER